MRGDETSGQPQLLSQAALGTPLQGLEEGVAGWEHGSRAAVVPAEKPPRGTQRPVPGTEPSEGRADF